MSPARYDNPNFSGFFFDTGNHPSKREKSKGFCSRYHWTTGRESPADYHRALGIRRFGGEEEAEDDGGLGVELLSNEALTVTAPPALSRMLLSQTLFSFFTVILCTPSAISNAVGVLPTN
jgi:hypothetical protein